MMEGQLLEGCEDVGDEDEAVGGLWWGLARGLIEDDVGGAELEGF
jgi:hypothetical protein